MRQKHCQANIDRHTMQYEIEIVFYQVSATVSYSFVEQVVYLAAHNISYQLCMRPFDSALRCISSCPTMVAIKLPQLPRPAAD